MIAYLYFLVVGLTSKNQKKLSSQEKKKLKRNGTYIAAFIVVLGLYLTISAFTDNYYGYLIAGPPAILFGLGVYFYGVKKIDMS